MESASIEPESTHSNSNNNQSILIDIPLLPIQSEREYNDSNESSPPNSPSTREEVFSLQSLENELPLDLRRRTKPMWKNLVYIELSYLAISTIILLLALIISANQLNHRAEDYHTNKFREFNLEPFHRGGQGPHPPPGREGPPPPPPPGRGGEGPHPPPYQPYPPGHQPPPFYPPRPSQYRSQPSTSAPSPSNFHPPKTRENSWGCENRDTRILWWASGQIILQSIMFLIGVALQWKLPATENEEITERKWKSIMSIYTFNRFSNLLWLVWTLLGIIWTFETISCPQPNLLFDVCFALSICHLGFLIIPVLFCCCSVPFAYFKVLYAKRRESQEKQERFDKYTFKFKYEKLKDEPKNSSKFSVRKDDATCPICLSEYENEEDIRFLKCKHHFHSECILEWLQQNSSCPMCKEPFDSQKEQAFIPV